MGEAADDLTLIDRPPCVPIGAKETEVDASPNTTEATKASGAIPTVGTRILHVVSSIDRGGIEISLLQVLRHIDRERYPMDFLVLQAGPGTLEPDLQALGSRVIYCPVARKPWALASELSKVLRRYGPYAIIQTHVHHLGGAILWIAARHRVPVRIAHSRNDLRPARGDSNVLRRVYEGTMKWCIARYATARVAVSSGAAEDLFGPKWAKHSCIIRSGRDFARFAGEVDTGRMRDSLGLPRDALVIGHVGRFHARKNHRFLVEVAAEIFQRRPDGKLLLVGDGPLMPEIRAQVEELGLSAQTVFAGARSDIPELMRAAMDVLVLPSHHEGLSMVLVEAQAAGLPCVYSDDLTDESTLVPTLMRHLPLHAPSVEWASVALAAASEARLDAQNALDAVLESDFNIEKSVARLTCLYDEQIARVQTIR